MYLTENAHKMESPGNNKEAIHSGHFMVSHFEAEAQDDDDTAVPIPDMAIKDEQKSSVTTNVIMDHFVNNKRLQPIAIENGLSTLFQCMSIAYRQKLTSPKWNRFRGIRLRWKDKIRLNNVIWRCWHMQFIRKQNTLICQFASPLDVDTHNKPEAIVLEGKYWKRKLEAVTAEYKKWRMFYKTQSFGHHKDANDLFFEMDLLRYDFPCPEGVNMLIDEDYMGLMSDTLFSTISNQPFAFPDTREIAKAGLSHFIQPSLGPLQPNLPHNDLMDFEDILSGKLPTVPEEPVCNKTLSWSYPDLDLATTSNNINLHPSSSTIEQYQTPSTAIIDVQQLQNNRQQPYANDILLQQQPSYSVISKNNVKTKEKGHQPTIYPDYQMAEMSSTPVTLTVLQLPQQTQQGFRGYKENYKKPNPLPGQSKIPQLVKEEKVNGMRSIQRVRRSRSNTREPLKRVVPPLQSAVSDPSLISPANNIILSQLLTNSSESLYRNAQATSSTSTESTIRCKEEQSVQSNVKLCVTSPVIISPVNMTAAQKSSDIALTSLSPPSSIIQENPSSLSSPTSPHGSLESLNREPIHREQRRAGHIHAEQKRRYNIKNGFDMMYSLIPPLNQNPNAKLSKAAMLQKGAEYIVQLRNEREQLKDEMDSLRQQIDSLTTSISNCQCLLPATGAPISSKKRDLKMQEMFDEYVRVRTNENWKFWIFSLLFKPLLASFNNFVSTTSLEDLYKTTFHWVEQHCALGDLRPIVFNSLKYLCTKTEILLMPDKLPEEARSQVIGPSTTTNHRNL